MRWVAVGVILAVLALTTTVNMGYVHVFRPLLEHVSPDDSVIHFVVMGLLCLTVNLAFADARPFGERLGMPLVTTLVLLGATLEELSQSYFPLRQVSLDDLLAGYLGIFVAAVGVALVRRFRPRPGLIGAGRGVLDSCAAAVGRNPAG